MPLAPSVPASFGEIAGALWREIAGGTFVYRAPTPEEARQIRADRKLLFENSAVPWIVGDIANLLQFYDDAQDLVAFSRLGARIFSPKRLRECLTHQATQGLSGPGAVAKCLCFLGGGRAKRATASAFSPTVLAAGVPAGLLFAALPNVPILAFAMLAGQVSYSLFGVGMRFGPLVGASMELTFRGLAALGLPFGPEHNKYHELQAARVLQRIDKGFGAFPHASGDDQLTTLWASQDALRRAFSLRPTILKPGDFPDFGKLVGQEADAFARLLGGEEEALGELVRDPWDTVKSLAGVAASIIGNIVPYVMNDLLGSMGNDAMGVLGGPPLSSLSALTPEQASVLSLQHQRRCPLDGACSDAVDDAIRFHAWEARRVPPRRNPVAKVARVDALYQAALGDPAVGMVTSSVPPGEVLT